jgi:fimbrial isopeptide formation D2 family protein
MNIKTATIFTLFILLSSSIIVGSSNIDKDRCPGVIDFDKKVWDGENWNETTIVKFGQNVLFNITLTYYRDSSNPNTFKLNTIKIRDELPDCLEYVNLDSIETTGSHEISYTEEFSNYTVYWNFSCNEPELDDEESLFLTFIATVKECEETNYLNNANITAMEDIKHFHTAEDSAEIIIVENHAPCTPIINGPDNGETGEELTFEIVADDPDRDDVFYYIDWDDEQENSWIGPFPSGKKVKVSYVWYKAGEYTVQAKAKDSFEYEGPWGNKINVDIELAPKNLGVSIDSGLHRYIKVNIQNNEETEFYDITWEILVNKRILSKQLIMNKGVVGKLKVGCTESVQVSPRGIGLITVTVKVNSPDIYEIVKTQKGFIIGKFVYLR